MRLLRPPALKLLEYAGYFRATPPYAAKTPHSAIMSDDQYKAAPKNTEKRFNDPETA